MIWYRHWIEIRGGFCVAAIFIAVMSLFFSTVVAGSTNWYTQSGGIINELDALTPRLSAMGPERFLPWGVHTWVCTLAAMLVGLFLGGTGIRTNGFLPGHPSMYYTLTLPISRCELIWTRFASSCAAVYVLFGAMLVIHCAALRIMGQSVPFGPMAASSFLAGLFVAGMLSVFGVLMPLWKEQVAGLSYFLAIGAVFRWAWPAMLRFAGGMVTPWLGIGAILLVTGAALSAAAVLARRLEF